MIFRLDDEGGDPGDDDRAPTAGPQLVWSPPLSAVMAACNRRGCAGWRGWPGPGRRPAAGRRQVAGLSCVETGTPSWWAPAPTGWWPPTSWPTRAGTSLVLEAQPEPGGAVRTAEVTAPGSGNDLFSAFYPLGRGPPVAGLGLRAPRAGLGPQPGGGGHPVLDGPTAVPAPPPGGTAASLDAFAAGRRGRLAGPVRPVAAGRAAARHAAVPVPARAAGAAPRPRVGPRRVAELASSPSCRSGGWPTSTSGGGAAGSCWPATPSTPTCPPTPRRAACWAGCWRRWARTSASRSPWAGRRADRGPGGRLRAAGGTLRCSAPVGAVVTERGRAGGTGRWAWRSAGRRSPPAGPCWRMSTPLRLFAGPGAARGGAGGGGAAAGRVPGGWATVKVDWALDRPVPWQDPVAGTAGTVHLAASLDELTLGTAEIMAGRCRATRSSCSGR